MFWGLIVQPNKKYSKTVSTPFHVSQAVLDLNNSSDSDVQLIVKSDEIEYILCVLNKSKTHQVPLDLIFSEGDSIAFRSVGGTVHLTGYLVDDENYPNSGGESGSEGEEAVPDLVSAKEDEGESGESADEDVSDDDDEEEADDDSDAEEEEESEDEDEDTKPPPAKIPKKMEKMQKMNGLANGQSKKGEKQKENKQKKSHSEKPEKAEKGEKPDRAIKTLPSGLKIQDIRVGQGAQAKAGKKIQVYYEGRFKSNNKVFDKANTGKGFEFVLGQNDVIKGWDMGIQGMRIGGKRKLICPPHLAYGSKGSPPAIPPNSTLVFEVVLRGVN